MMNNILWKIWLILGVIITMYALLLVSFSGFGNIFYDLCIPIGLFFLLAAWVTKKHLIAAYVPKSVQIICGTILGLCVLCFAFIEARILTGFGAVPSKDVEYMIVLGCGARNGQPSAVLKKRLDTALEYALSHEDVKIIVSGGLGEDELSAEALVMKKYMASHGVAEERITMEDQSKDTSQNLAFSKQFTEDGAAVAIVSNDFHIYRAVQLAKKLGYSDPQGLAARDDLRTFPANLLREFFGVMKDWVTGNMTLF